jgi:hypothetical protein
LRGATLSKHRGTAFCTMRGRDEWHAYLSLLLP